MGDPFAILVTDIHLTEKTEDQYRFGLFDWLIKKYRNSTVQVVFILGDLTSRKDNHSAWFVNKIVKSFRRLAKHFDIYILKGNHDFMDPKSPFFEFVNEMDHVGFFTEPTIISRKYGKGKPINIVMLPHSKDPDTDWSSFDADFEDADVIFLHQTFSGSRTENGTILDGVSPKKFKKYRAKVFSGDIHVPQKVGPVVYVGAPYHIRFGDNFKPRILVADKKFRTTDVRFPAPAKWTTDIEHPSDLDKLTFRAGDWVKIKLHLRRSEFVDWPKYRSEIKAFCEASGLELHGIELCEIKRTRLKLKGTVSTDRRKRRTPTEIFQAYCLQNKVDSYTREIGKALMEEGRK